MIKFIEAAEAIIPKGYFVEESGDRIYIYKDNVQKQSYVYMFYAEEAREAPNECLDLLKTILDMRM